MSQYNPPLQRARERLVKARPGRGSQRSPEREIPAVGGFRAVAPSSIYASASLWDKGISCMRFPGGVIYSNSPNPGNVVTHR